MWAHLTAYPSTSSIRMGTYISALMSQDRHIPRLAFAPMPAELPVKPDQAGRGTLPMDAFVSRSCPSLYQPYIPPRWMRKCVTWLFPSSCMITHAFFDSGHVQTAYCVAGDFTRVDKVVYHRQVEAASGLQPILMLIRRKFLRTVDGGTLCVVQLNSPTRVALFRYLSQRPRFYTPSR